MPGEHSTPMCRVCGKPVAVSGEFGEPTDVHLICYHFAFEHDADPDQPCGKINCLQFILQAYKEKLIALGQDADEVVEEAIRKRRKPKE